MFENEVVIHDCKKCMCKNCLENRMFEKDGLCTGCHECGKDTSRQPCLMTGE